MWRQKSGIGHQPLVEADHQHREALEAKGVPIPVECSVLPLLSLKGAHKSIPAYPASLQNTDAGDLIKLQGK